MKVKLAVRIDICQSCSSPHVYTPLPSFCRAAARPSPAQLVRFSRRVAVARGRAPRAGVGVAMSAYLKSGELSRLMASHFAKGTLAAGWDEVQSRLLEHDLAWKLQTPPPLPCRRMPASPI